MSACLWSWCIVGYVVVCPPAAAGGERGSADGRHAAGGHLRRPERERQGQVHRPHQGETPTGALSHRHPDQSRFCLCPSETSVRFLSPQSTLPNFKQNEFSVVRQHEEFIWLHDSFVENEEYAGYIVRRVYAADIHVLEKTRGFMSQGVKRWS